MSPSIHTSISISLGASSIAHTPCHSISHPCSPITISRGSLYDKHTLSPPHVCIFSVRLSRPLSLVCQTPLGHVLGVLLSRFQTTTHYLLTLPPLSKMHVWYVCIRHTRFFSTFIVCCPCLFHTRTHTFFTHSFYLSLSLVRDSVTSISIWMFWKVKPQKSLTRYMWRKTFTSGTIIRFITTCTYFILSFIFGIVDISNFFINLVKVSKVWLKKMLELHYRTEGVALSLSLSLLSLTGLPSHSNSLYRRIIRSLCQRIAPYIV